MGGAGQRWRPCRQHDIGIHPRGVWGLAWPGGLRNGQLKLVSANQKWLQFRNDGDGVKESDGFLVMDFGG